ncbi:hypothetical protein NKR23_g10671 [Pleurostoma richardsiae]|uniref:F-box domain-containing protein n=1 Tax=Pleurostoma richardsiae TaxID=41990 RepID=A0AA38R9K2_9PEZI|nr:hypothetical protein NKR23_g10671 [Pleurostoma richardsiae]
MALEAPLSPTAARIMDQDSVGIVQLGLGALHLSDHRRLSSAHFEAMLVPASLGLSDVPVEISLLIFRALDMPSAFNLASTNKHFKAILDNHLDSILLPILTRDLSPLDGLLQAIVAKPEDLDRPQSICLSRRIKHKTKLLCEGDSEYDEKTKKFTAPILVELDSNHIKRLQHMYKVVKGWERLFSHYRFVNGEDRRALLPHESERLRGALYYWMRYAYYFHGNLPRLSPWIPRKDSTDVRCNWLRLLSDPQLHEFEDLWATVRVIVEQAICPSVEFVRKTIGEPLTTADLDKISFGSAQGILMPGLTPWSENARWINVNKRIVDTFLKLSPEEILHLVDCRSQYSKGKLVRMMRTGYPNILQDTQSLTSALDAVLQERRESRERALSGSFLDLPTDLFSTARSKRWARSGGILDWIGVDDEAIREYWARNSKQLLKWDSADDANLPEPVIMPSGKIEP